MNENADEQKKNIDDVENSEELKKEMLKPIVKSKSETDKELQDLEVETTAVELAVAVAKHYFFTLSLRSPNLQKIFNNDASFYG